MSYKKMKKKKSVLFF